MIKKFLYIFIFSNFAFASNDKVFFDKNVASLELSEYIKHFYELNLEYQRISQATFENFNQNTRLYEQLKKEKMMRLKLVNSKKV
ncbi:MAG: hypothetical protein ACXWL2_01210 [Candidatus Chromulinivorax sp.]